MSKIKRLKQEFVFRAKCGVQKLAEHFGYEIVEKPLAWHLINRKISVVLDVGASVGGYGHSIRQDGYNGKIVSFEPLPSAYEQLNALSRKSPPWQTLNCALGSRSGNIDLHVASNGDSSSTLRMLPRSTDVAGISEQRTMSVQVRRLDEMLLQYAQPGERVFLKVDVQGFELDVLKGAGAMLSAIDGLQLELSLIPLYEGAPVIEEVLAYVRKEGFLPIWMFHGFKDSLNKELLQVDGLFFRDNNEMNQK